LGPGGLKGIGVRKVAIKGAAPDPGAKMKMPVLSEGKPTRHPGCHGPLFQSAGRRGTVKVETEIVETVPLEGEGRRQAAEVGAYLQGAGETVGNQVAIGSALKERQGLCRRQVLEPRSLEVARHYGDAGGGTVFQRDLVPDQGIVVRSAALESEGHLLRKVRIETQIGLADLDPVGVVVGVPGLRLPEARALAALAAHVSERKFDGRFDVRAFVAWLSSHHGSFDLEEITLTR
jgi:hypothetical protein